MALTIGDNFSYKGAKPLDARLKYDTLATMKAVADSELYEGILAYCVGADKTYQWKSTNTVEAETGKWREFTSGGGGGQTIQVDTMPSAGADEVGHIYEYTGDTTASFVNGRFYKCVTDGTTYEWAEVLMNDNETQEISKADFDALPQSEKDNGKAYFIPDASVVSNFTVMGNRFDKANIYTEDERMIGSWMGKPLYQKVCKKSFGSITDKTPSTINFSDTLPSDIEWIMPVYGSCKDSYGGAQPISQAWINTYWIRFNSAITVETNRNIFSNKECTVVFQYTKTTDGEVKIGAPNDYSTDEMIVGTWIDGKPIYQKTFVGDTAPTVERTVLASNVDRVINAFGSQTYGQIEEFHFPFVSATLISRWIIGADNDLIYVRQGSDKTVFTNYAWTFQYTKTTD